MKTVFVVVFSALFVLSIALGASAATNTTLYLDVIPSGAYDFSLASVKLNSSAPLTGVLVGAESTFGTLKAGLEFGSASSKEGDKGLYPTRDATLNAKFGYRVLNNDQITLDAIGSYYSVQSTVPATNTTDKVSGLLLGADVAFRVLPQLAINGSYQFSVSVTQAENGVEYPGNPTVSLLSLKANYSMTPNLGITGGYRSYFHTLTPSGTTMKENFSGLTLGACYKLQ